MLRGYLLVTGHIPIVGEPPAFQRLEAFRRGSVRARPRTDNVVDEVAFIVDQHLLGRHRARRIARHDVLVTKPDDLRGTAQLSRGFAIPERKQYVAVRRQEYAGLRVLKVSRPTRTADRLDRAVARDGQVEDGIRLPAQPVEFCDGLGTAKFRVVDVPRHR